MAYDDKYRFDFEDLDAWMNTDPEFFIKVAMIKSINYYDLDEIPATTFSALMKDQGKIEMRNDILDYYKAANTNNAMQAYVIKPFTSPLFELTDERLMAENFNHLEYYPIVNQRAYSFGKETSKQDDDAKAQSSKEILNVQFKETYYKFLLMAVHQDYQKSRITEEIKLRLIYYLKLQDRINEAILLFNTLDKN